MNARQTEGAGGVSGCSADLARARSLLEAGKLWSTTRALEPCADHPEALALLFRASLALGRSDEASRLIERMPERNADFERALSEEKKRQQARKPVDDAALSLELEEIRANLSRGECAEASRRALESVGRWTPNPKALVLGGAAASCRGDASLANNFYARAAVEFEASAGLSWVQPEAPRAVGFTAPDELLLQLGGKSMVVRLGSPPHEPATIGPRPQAPQRNVWRNAQVEVVLESGSLLGRAVGTHQRVWTRELPDGVHDFLPAFSADELLLVAHDLTRVRSTWQRLKSTTGQVVSQGSFPARFGEVIAGTNADWFAAIALTEERKPHLMHLVFSSARTKPVDLASLHPCSPSAVFSERELLMTCPEELRALSVDTLQQRPLARFPADFSASAAVRGPDNWWALRGPRGLAVAKLSADGTQSFTKPPELQHHQFLDVDWSLDGRALAGNVVRADGLRGAVLWDRESATLLEFWHQPEAQFPDAALSATGDDLVMGGCSELGRLHLDSGRFEVIETSTPACAGFTVAPTTGVLRLVARGNGSGVFWSKDGELRPITLGSRVEEAQAVGPWLAANTSAGARLLLPATGRELSLPPETRVLALTSDGSYAVLRQVVPGSHYNILLMRVDAQSLSLREVWRQEKSEFRYAAFTPDRRTLALWSATATAHLDLNELRLERVDARWPDRGARLLDTSSNLFDGRAGLLAGHSLIPLEAWRPTKTRISLDLQFGKGLKPPSAFTLLGLSRTNRWIVGPIEGGAAIWRAPRGELVAQIQHSPTGGWLVTAAAGADKQESLVQPLGTERVPLWCRAGDELYEWRVCQDRFEEPTLLRGLLSGGR